MMRKTFLIAVIAICVTVGESAFLFQPLLTIKFSGVEHTANAIPKNYAL